MTRPVILLPAARDDLVAVYAAIFAENPAAAGRWLDAARETFEVLLARNPEMGVRRDYGRAALAGMRMIAIKGFANYLAFYRADPDAIRIVRVLHGVRDIPSVPDPTE